MPKTVMLSDDAYEELKRHKVGKESFSKVVKKLSKCGCPGNKTEQPEKKAHKHKGK